jgi:hypothetical protein
MLQLLRLKPMPKRQLRKQKPLQSKKKKLLKRLLLQTRRLRLKK